MQYVQRLSVLALCPLFSMSVAHGQSVDSATVLPVGAVRDVKDPRIIRFGATPSETPVRAVSYLRAVKPASVEEAREAVTKTLAPFFFEAIEAGSLSASSESLSVARAWVLKPVQLLSWMDQLRGAGVQYVEPAPGSFMYDFPGWLLGSQRDSLDSGLKKSTDKNPQAVLVAGTSRMVSVADDSDPDTVFKGRLEGCSVVPDVPDWCRLTGVFSVVRTPFATVISLPLGGSQKEELVLAWPTVAPATIDDFKKILVETRVARNNEAVQVDVPLFQIESNWSVSSENAVKVLWGKPVAKGSGDEVRLMSAFSVSLLADQLAPFRVYDGMMSINKFGNGFFFLIRRSDGFTVAMGWIR